MTQDSVTSLIVDAMGVTIKIAAPLLLVGLIIGLAVSVFQAVTQIQEQTLSFIPKTAGLAVVLVVGATLMSMGMVMLPPVFISLPFKILLFVLVDGWNLVTRSLVESFHT